MNKVMQNGVAIVLVFSIYAVCFVKAGDFAPDNLQGGSSEEVVGSPVIATITADTKTKYSPAENAGVVEHIKTHTPVEILKDRSLAWYYVKNMDTQKEGWIAAEHLHIPPDKKTNPIGLGVDVLELYAQSFTSQTNHFLWTDIDRQRTYVFERQGERWVLRKNFVCATGKNVSPTKRGLYRLTDRGEWFYSERLHSGAQYWIRYSGSYLFHSVAMDQNKNITDGIVGERRSSGCVRFLLEDIQWIYENIADGTTVYIH